MDLTESQESVNVYFVYAKDGHPEESSCDMKICFQCCVEHDLHPEWLSEDCCLELSPVKRDVFVFEDFKGEAYEYLCTSKCVRIVGPRCIMTCLIGGFPVPTGQSPIFTVGMRDLIVTATNFPEDMKKKLRQTVELMGGMYTNKLRKSVTHIVAHHVISSKHELALQMGIPAMTEEWVWAVWAASKERNVHGKDEEFQVHKCDVFHNLSVTCSGLPRKQKKSIEEQITKHGGECTAELSAKKTKILIVTDATGDKYRHASQWQIPCVYPEWVSDSLEKGRVLPLDEKYLVKNVVKCSTPVQDTSKFLPNFSTISSIHGEMNATHVNETAWSSTSATVSSMSVSTATPRTPVKKPVANNYIDVVNKLDIRDAKRAGSFLDGCKVYLSGFTTEMNEKLRRILNAGGATRFNEISESISHVIVGDFVASDMMMITSNNYRPHIVRVEWLLESIKNRCPVPEDRFSVTDNKQATEPPSPLSKKGVQLLRRPSELSLQPPDLNETEASQKVKETTPEPDSVVRQYLNASQTEALESFNTTTYLERRNKDSSTRPEPTLRENVERDSESLLAEVKTQSSCAETVEEIFRGLSFTIVGYDSEDTADLEEIVQTHGGRVVSRGFKGIPDYGVVPIQGERLRHTTNEVVTYLWVHECAEKEEIVPIQYYHRPVTLDRKLEPLQGCVIGITTYSGKDRDFVNALAQLLGAKTQETFARVDCKAKKSVASTHLVCPEPGSQKYQAAQKWNMPAVTHEWLLACAREGRRVSEKPYLVKETDSYKGENVSSRKSLVVSDNSEKVLEKAEFNPPAQGVTPARQSSSKRSVASDKPVTGKKVSDPQAQRVTPARPSCSNERVCKLDFGDTPKARSTRLQADRVEYSPPTPVTPWKSNGGCVDRRTVLSPETPIADLIPSPVDGVTPQQNHDVSLASVDGDIPTPETPYGQVFKPNPSPATRKFWKRWIDRMPDFEKVVEQPVVKRRRLSTPASELKRQILIKCGVKFDINQGTISQCGSECSSKDKNDEEKDVSHSLQQEKAEEEPNVCSEESPAGINTQLNNLGQILTVQSKVNSPRIGPREQRDCRKGVDGSDGGSSGSSKGADLPASLEVNTDFVDWVDPAQSDEILKPKPKFSLSSNIEERARYELVISKLGGSVSDKQNFDPTATHLVIVKPARNEKLLASIAAGKWVLHKSYLDACEEAGRFVEEEAFEWGNPKAPQVGALVQPGGVEAQLSGAAHRWRRQRGGGAFQGMRFLVHAGSREKTESYARLVTAGGGHVVDSEADATHCLAELGRTRRPLDLEALARRGVPVLQPIFLHNSLVRDPPPSVDSALVPEYRDLLRKLGLDSHS